MTQQASPYHFLAHGAQPQRGNVTTHVTDALRQAIVLMELKPGEPIDKNAICDRMSVSRFPVSEALARLQAEGLVDILPQRGSTVSLIRIADVLEYMLIRKALESEAVRALIGNHSPRAHRDAQPQSLLPARRRRDR
jgi:DNA-binding GntR family transcriptional regulator